MLLSSRHVEPMAQPDTLSTIAFLRARDLTFSHGGHAVLGPLNFSVGPGLTWVCGGDGKGKTTLLRLMAGRLQPTQGTLVFDAKTVFDEGCSDPSLDETSAQTWLADLQPLFPGWDHALHSQLGEALGLADHLHKPLFMLSAGSRRKVGLLAAAASGAHLTLLDVPFAALDAPSSRALTQVLQSASKNNTRAWVVADYERPAWVLGLGRARLIELGD